MRAALEFAPGLVLDDTGFKVRQGGWTAVNKVRFYRGRPQVIGGWEAITSSTLTGKCRGILPWRDNNDRLNIALGTHSNLYAIVGGDLFDITPSGLAAGLEDSTGGQGYGTGAYSTGTYSSPSTADYVARTWSFAPYGQTLLATPSGGTVYQWANDTSAAAVSLGATTEVEDDFSAYADNTALDAVWTRGTGWSMDAANDQVDCDGSQSGDSDLKRASYGLTAGKWYRVEADFSNRSAGSISAFGGGNAGTASTAASGTVTLQFRAANASADVGARGDTDFVGSVDEIRIVELNAPDEVQAISVPMNRRHVIAYGCSEEATNTFNPRAIRWCDFEDLNAWASLSSNNAGEYVLEGSGAIIGVKESAYGAFIWTTNEIWFQEYLGAPDQTYQFTRLGTNCGLIGPNACVVFEGSAFWMSPDGGFWTCPAGGVPTRISTPVEQTVRANLAFVQQAKVYASSVSQFREIWFFYPDSRDGNENSRYVSFQLDDAAWSAGELARTAFCDAGAGPSPVGVDGGGNVYYHERGASANGDSIDWSAESGDVYVDESDHHLMFRGIRPDVEDQQGLARLEIITKAYPQGDETTHGPYDLTVSRDKVDFRATGRIARVKLYGSAAPCRFRLGRINMDMTVRGRR
ncbi:MAG: hypothetical protein VX529_11010 [Pseudomonadota bacterium]|nr:hypothetical protein [Pseudomonadota bacterium]